MKEVKVKVTDLLDVIRRNRENHIVQFQDACKDYKDLAILKVEEATKNLLDQVRQLKEGQAVQLGAIVFNIPYPENHQKDYDRVIKMLEMSVDKELMIDSRLFSQYVMDAWEWSEDFGASYTSNKMMLRATSAR